ncbi:MAG: MarR family winged helix-turn-helix transcriptional regulator [Actinomycetota bacterium]
MVTLTDEDYRRLLEFRTGLRRFLRWSGSLAESAGLTAAQHQLLLAIRGHDDVLGPTVSDVAGYLLVRHHSVVQLVDRVEAAGLVRRRPDATDTRAVRLRLTAKGERCLAGLVSATTEELARVGPQLNRLWKGL